MKYYTNLTFLFQIVGGGSVLISTMPLSTWSQFSGGIEFLCIWIPQLILIACIGSVNTELIHPWPPGPVCSSCLTVVTCTGVPTSCLMCVIIICWSHQLASRFSELGVVLIYTPSTATWHDCMSPYTCKQPAFAVNDHRFRHYKPPNQQSTCWSFNRPGDHRSLDEHYIAIIIRSMHACISASASVRCAYGGDTDHLPHLGGLKLWGAIWSGCSTTGSGHSRRSSVLLVHSLRRRILGIDCNPETAVITQLPWVFG